MRKSRKIFRSLFKVTGADKVFKSYFCFFIITALVIWLVEPNIKTFFDSIWYCFVASATIGFGDLTAITVIGRVFTMILSIYSLGVVAIFTAVITSYFMENAKSKAKDNVRKFIDELEHLDELSKDELKDLSERVKKFNKRF